MMKNLHICSDKVLTWKEQVNAAGVAIRENNLNSVFEFGDPLVSSDMMMAPSHIEVGAAVLLTGKKWQNGRTITIGFLDGNPTVQEKVKAYANTWMNYVNLVFKWVADAKTADIRITFTRGGSWSYLGTDNLNIAKPNPTMQYGWLDVNSTEDEIRRVTIHEFGHMLSLGHEQGHPTGNIPWNKPVVYDYYRRTNGWDQAQVDSQVFKLYSTTQTNYSVYDRLSIMHYSIPAELLLDASKAVGWNTTLSATDIAHMKKMYPKPVVTAPSSTTLVEDLKTAGFKPLRTKNNVINVVDTQFDNAEIKKLIAIGDKHNRPVFAEDASTVGNSKFSFGVE